MAGQPALSPLDTYLNDPVTGPAQKHEVLPSVAPVRGPVYIPSEIRLRIRSRELKLKLQELAEPGESARDLVERILMQVFE